MKDKITVQTLTKNGDEFIREALLSVKDYVKKIVVCDTGSTDNTIPIIKELIKEGLNIEFIQRGPFKGLVWTSRRPELTTLRNEILNNCETEWMMLVDEDEIFTKEIFEEMYEVLKDDRIMAVAMPYYNFVDRYHVLRKSLGPLSKRVIRAKYVEFRGDGRGISNWMRGETKQLNNYTDSRVVALKNKFYHYNLAKKNYGRPREKSWDDIIKFEGKQPFDFPNWNK